MGIWGSESEVYEAAINSGCCWISKSAIALRLEVTDSPKSLHMCRDAHLQHD